jgi:hypothetical protein
MDAGVEHIKNPAKAALISMTGITGSTSTYQLV